MNYSGPKCFESTINRLYDQIKPHIIRAQSEKPNVIVGNVHRVRVNNNILTISTNDEISDRIDRLYRQDTGSEELLTLCYDSANRYGKGFAPAIDTVILDPLMTLLADVSIKQRGLTTAFAQDPIKNAKFYIAAILFNWGFHTDQGSKDMRKAYLESIGPGFEIGKDGALIDYSVKDRDDVLKGIDEKGATAAQMRYRDIEERVASSGLMELIGGATKVCANEIFPSVGVERDTAIMLKLKKKLRGEFGGDIAKLIEYVTQLNETAYKSGNRNALDLVLNS